MKARTLLAIALSVLPLATLAQENGQWRAASTTAKGVTGDIAFTDTKIAINFSAYTLAQIRTLETSEVDALFQAGHDAVGKGNLFRTAIPGDKRFAHKNTLCGSEDVQWVVTWVNGKSLQTAMFSGADMPKLTPEALANTTALCGTFAYVR